MLVLDPFVGVGSTALAAKRQGRHYIGFESNPDYVEICRRRLSGEEAAQQPSLL
jgi:site-specific DNA-methyltransferase (adenine-specific)